MSKIPNVTADCDVSDPYVDHLRKKYLRNYDETAATRSSATFRTSDAEPFTPLPANPSLTESERKHYNRAMKELGKAFRLSEDHLKTSVAEFEKSMRSSNEASDQLSVGKRNEINSDSAECTSTDLQVLTDATDTDVVPWPASMPTGHGTLPSTIPLESEDTVRPKQTTTTFASSEDPALVWEDGSTMSGSSRRFYSNSESDRPISMPDVKAIYTELMSIYEKLQDEKGRIAERQILEEKLESNFDSQAKELAIREAFLLEKEKELLERERALSLGLQNMKRTKEIAAKLEGVELEVQEKIDLLQQGHQLEIERLNCALQERARVLKRLKNSFNVVKEQNDDLKSRFDDVSSDAKKAKAQNVKLKKRLENLQRRQEFRSCKPQDVFRSSKGDKENFDKQGPAPLVRNPDKSTKHLSGMLEALSVSFDWLSEISLKGLNVTLKLNEKAMLVSHEFIVDKCLKILPLLVDVVKILPSHAPQKKYQISFLSFTYLCLCSVDDSQHSLLSSTSRRLGDELYKPAVTSGSSQKNTGASLILATFAGSSAVDTLESLSQSDRTLEHKPYSNVYFRSNNPEIRLLSCFVILKTLHQVDVLAHVFGQIKKDLKDESNRRMFLNYNASHIILPYITYRANKALMGDAVDVILQMSMESALLPAFLEQCSNEPWFRAFSSALRASSSSLDKSSPNTSMIEKLSIILQKLSKMKSNRNFFDAFSMGRNLQECYRICDPKNTFLTLNLRSILFNLNLLKDSSNPTS